MDEMKKINLDEMSLNDLMEMDEDEISLDDLMDNFANSWKIENGIN